MCQADLVRQKKNEERKRREEKRRYINEIKKQAIINRKFETQKRSRINAFAKVV